MSVRTPLPPVSAAADEKYMARALELAAKGRGRTSPNPLVGCVIISAGEIVGEGWHERTGGPHAEAIALAQAGDRARGATAYVTLEPCNHHGRTPPCSEALIEAGVSRVVIAHPDPNPQAGGGAARLKAAGVEVLEGVLEDDAAAQNEPFATVHSKGRPFILYKTAMTLDGKIATRSGQSRWITGEASRARVQQWRDEYDAIAVGVNTVLLDDPLLTTRIPGGRTPVKVIFDSVARTSPSARLFEADVHGQPARVIIFCTDKAGKDRLAALEARGAEVVLLQEQGGRPDINTALRELAERGLNSVLLEGGGTLAWAFMEARAIDKVAWFVAPMLIGGTGRSPLGGLGVEHMADAYRLSGSTSEWIDGDLLITGRIDYGRTDK